MVAQLTGLALGFLCTQSFAVTFPLTWRWSNPTPHGNNIIDIATTNQFWIQVAERGQVYTSGDLATWTPRDTHTTRALRSVTFFDEQILISGESGTILAGSSAADLKLIDLASDDWLEGVTASSDRAIAVGDNGAVYASPDGISWQRQNTGFTDWLRSAAYGPPGTNGTFVVVGEAGFVGTSNDGGAHWQTQKRIATEDLNRVAWFGGQFWAVGDAGTVFQSAAGKNWTSVNTGATNVLNAVTGFQAIRLVAGDSEVRLQTGRPPWRDELARSKPFPAPAWTYLSATSDTNSFLLCGRTGTMTEGILATNNTSDWFPVSDSLRNWLWDVKRFPNLYFAVGDRATILSSLDGITWALELPPDAATNSIFLGIGGKTNLAVAVGNAGTIITSFDGQDSLVSTNSDGTLVTNIVSTFGIFWDAVSPRPTTNDLQGVTVFNDRFVVSGASGTILTSDDARAWTTQRTPTSSFLSSLESYPGGLVAVGRNGTILTSPDAVTWTSRASSTTNWIYRVRYLGGTLIAVGQNGTILTSTNGNDWVFSNSGSTHWLNDIQRIDETYFVVGDQGTVLSSPDARTWTDRGTITGKSLFGAATDDAMLITVGVEGVILRSRVVPIDTPVAFLRFPTGPEESVFLFAGQVNQRFTLDRSTNLIDWTTGPVLEIDDSGTLLHVDEGTNSIPKQFFRAINKP